MISNVHGSHPGVAPCSPIPEPIDPARPRLPEPTPDAPRFENQGRRIALFTGNFLHVVDGVSRTLNRLVDYLEARGYHVLVFGPTHEKPPSTEMRRFVPISSLPLPGRSEYRLALGLPGAARRRLAAFAPDLVHIATPDLLGLGALNWARAQNLPVVTTYHTHFPAYLRFYKLGVFKQALRRYMRWFYSRCRHVYVPTAPLMNYFRDLGIAGNLKLWGRGVDTQQYNPHWRSARWRLERAVGPGDVLVTYVGRLVREKGLDLFATVIEGLRERGVAVRSMVVGEGPLRSELEARLTGTIFTGHLEGRELLHAYASSDVFLFPSDSEAFGNVIVEAMASGLPVVCAGSSGSSSHVVPGETGLLAPPGDAGAFLEHTQGLVLNREERLRMGRRARSRASRYDWQQTLTTMARYYEEALTLT